MTYKEFVEKLKTNNLGHLTDQFDKVIRNCIRLYLSRQEEDEIPMGKSKIGGRPDLPALFSWPTEIVTKAETQKGFLFFKKKRNYKVEEPLAFIAQINFSEVSHLDTEDLLPKNGIAYFFYSAEQDAWGFDIKDKSKFKVLFYEGDQKDLVRLPFPAQLLNFADYLPCSITPKQEISLPTDGSEYLQFLNDEESEILHEKVFEDININKILGYSDNIQGEMELECELVTNGLYCGDSSGYNHPKAKELAPNAVNWRLLLQVDSNDECEMMWGDVGRLYFWIKKQDMIDKRFENSWLILQCS